MKGTMKGRPAARLVSGLPAAAGTAALAAVTLFAAGACSAQSAGTFTPEGTSGASAAGGQASDAATSSGGGYVMPPFGHNVKVEMTSWRPGNATQAAAVSVDKDYELAFLYAEYRSGQDDSWENYVGPEMQTEVQATLQASDVTTESFTGTVKYFDMSVIPDPLVKGDLDVSACFDNAGASNTNATTGKVIPATSSPDSDYVLVTNELRDESGQWEVISGLPSVSYPQAAQCKP
jgi:hypothetical protein